MNAADTPRASHSEEDPDDAPIDLTAMWADNHLLDRVGSGQPLDPNAEPVEQVLGDWRHSIHARAMPPFNMTGEALRRIRATRRRYRITRRLRWLTLTLLVLAAFTITAWIAAR